MSEVSASDLMFSEVRDMFGLKLDKRSMEFWELKKSDIIPVPEVVCKPGPEYSIERFSFPVSDLVSSVAYQRHGKGCRSRS